MPKLKLQPEEVVVALARLDDESKQEFAHILVTRWSTLARHIASMMDDAWSHATVDDKEK